jgi:hypothetical protein
LPTLFDGGVQTHLASCGRGMPDVWNWRLFVDGRSALWRVRTNKKNVKCEKEVRKERQQ